MSNFTTFLNPLILFPLLAAAVLIYYLIRTKYRWFFLLILSMVFYIWISSWAVMVLLFSIILNYTFGYWINQTNINKKKIILIMGILFNIGLLVSFKYWTNAISLVFTKVNTSANIIFPIGLSFITVQNISYLIDVSKKIITSEQNVGIFALYVSFFPKISAGPIERGKNLIPQFLEDHPFYWENISWGIRQITFGLFKKFVIADRLAIFANEIFNNPNSYHGLATAFGILCFAFQIYYDFSGYSDLAVGIARLFGIRLTINFKRPYFAEDIVEFWNRWHISFSIWLRDYIFYPIRRFILKNFRNASLLSLFVPSILTMVASGIWHGTGSTFIFWGLYHAFLYSIVIILKKYSRIESLISKTWMKYPQILLNFSLVTIGWVFFRAASVGDIGLILHNLFQKSSGLWELKYEVFNILNFYFSIALILFATLFELIGEFNKIRFDNLPKTVRWVAYCFLILAISTLGVFQTSGNPFVYFKF